MIKLNLNSPATQFAVFLVILGFNVVLFSILTTTTAVIFYGIEDLYSAGALRYISSLTQLGIFGLTAFECAFLFSNKQANNYLQLNKGVSYLQCFFIILIAAVSTPVLSYIIEWNEGMKLPQFMSSVETWMLKQEENTAEITSILLSGNSLQVMFINLAVIAIIPAVCEEFLFRGLILTWLKKQIPNIHVVVILTACIFSAIHLQFYGFVPRFLLGLYLGYLFVWTGSIWTCVIAHFINNATAVIVSYLFNNQFITTDYQVFGNVGNNYWIIGLSALLTAACVYAVYKVRKVYKVESL